MPSNITYSRIGDDVLARWAKVRAVCAGADAVKAGKYLPYLNKADTSEANRARNDAYVDRAMFYDATGNTLRGLIGLAFRVDPSHDLPERLQYLLDDADGSGVVSIYQQSQNVLSNVLQVGRHGLYVDFSDALARPVIKTYIAESIINWRVALVGGKSVLTLVVLYETAEQDDGYGIEYIDQWRELALIDGAFVSRVWRISDGGEPYIFEEVTPTSRAGNLDFIPFVFVGSESNIFEIGLAPLAGLAELNIGHFRNSADYEDSAFFVGQAQPWMSGLTEEWRDWLQKSGMYIGSRNPILLPEKGAFGFAQVQPNTLAKEAMDQKEAQMIALGARLVEPTQASKTATEASGDREASTSVLAMCVANVSEAYATAIEMCGRYLNISDVQAEYKINQDFVQMQADPQMITALVAAWQSGAFSKVDLRAFLRKLSVIDVERTDEQIDEEIETHGPALGSVGV